MDDIMTELINYAMWEKHISVKLSSELSPYTPSVADSETRSILINTNWYLQQQLPLHLAHEIAHIINGDHATHPLYFSPMQSDYKMELNANRTAIKLLIPYYLQERSSEQVNVTEFMTCFVIPSHLENIVREELREAL
ncbi:ImmA/IrrE family metallo-endopeptidase [Levilactobacillus angrenensis]|uniref:ImmA/IrrE family metallo-endopeptidase n=1 Tax=Levilactobacillus angrenensis TaxID=2486020 RepID=A0ABW1UAM6_9LACO|nr:ImmA/IrrE family metallo-endopeptidase [Levilactobacillus angrenensis]